MEGNIKEEANPVLPPRFSGWDESLSANNVFDFAVSVPQAWREGGSRHKLFDWPTYCVYVSCRCASGKDSSLKGNKPTHLISGFQKSIVELTEQRRSARRIDTFLFCPQQWKVKPTCVAMMLMHASSMQIWWVIWQVLPVLSRKPFLHVESVTLVVFWHSNRGSVMALSQWFATWCESQRS